MRGAPAARFNGALRRQRRRAGGRPQGASRGSVKHNPAARARPAACARAGRAPKTGRAHAPVHAAAAGRRGLVYPCHAAAPNPAWRRPPAPTFCRLPHPMPLRPRRAHYPRAGRSCVLPASAVGATFACHPAPCHHRASGPRPQEPINARAPRPRGQGAGRRRPRGAAPARAAWRGGWPLRPGVSGRRATEMGPWVTLCPRSRPALLRFGRSAPPRAARGAAAPHPARGPIRALSEWGERAWRAAAPQH